jgi:hypothetical protein
MKSTAIVLLKICVFATLLMTSCDKDEKMITPTVVPIDESIELHLRGYVTDDDSVLVSKIYDFTRRFVRRDTIDGKATLVFVSNNEQNIFRIENGRLMQLTNVNLFDRVFPAKIRLLGPTQFSYWETLYSEEDGLGTEWQVKVDTTVTAIDSTGRSVAIRYVYSANARNEGWKDVFIPRTYQPEKLVDVYWRDVRNEIINLTASDTLFYRVGTAHHYFDPALGIVKYVTDYEIKERGKPIAKLHGTWELMDVKTKN